MYLYNCNYIYMHMYITNTITITMILLYMALDDIALHYLTPLIHFPPMAALSRCSLHAVVTNDTDQLLGDGEIRP